jgi:hypothetical protein
VNITHRQGRLPLLAAPGGPGERPAPVDDIKDFLTWTDDDPYWQARMYQATAQMVEDLTRSPSRH